MAIDHIKFGERYKSKAAPEQSVLVTKKDPMDLIPWVLGGVLGGMVLMVLFAILGAVTRG